VSRVTYRSKAEAAARATRDPQLAPLAGASEGNPFPASFVLEMRDPGIAPRVLRTVSGDPAVDPKIPASYTAAQAQHLNSALGAMKFIAGALDLVALGVGAVVALALLRGEVRARREELRILTLVGVPRLVIRVPLVVQVLSVAVAGSALAIVSLVYIGQHVVPAIDQSLPFLRLGDPRDAFSMLAVGTLYELFPSKEAMLRQLLEDRIDRLLDRLRDAAAHADEPREQIEQIVRTHLRFFQEDPVLLRLTLSAWSGSDFTVRRDLGERVDAREERQIVRRDPSQHEARRLQPLRAAGEGHFVGTSRSRWRTKRQRWPSGSSAS